MGFFSRLATFFRIRANAALDKAEDPGQVMDYSYSKQLEQLQQLRRSIADVVTNEKRLEMQQSQLIERMNKLEPTGDAGIAGQSRRPGAHGPTTQRNVTATNQ